MQASEFFEIVRVTLKKFHKKFVSFPLLLALHTLVTLFSFQGAVLVLSRNQIQTLKQS